jgi:hypothetical protein
MPHSHANKLDADEDDGDAVAESDGGTGADDAEDDAENDAMNKEGDAAAVAVDEELE